MQGFNQHRNPLQAIQHAMVIVALFTAIGVQSIHATTSQTIRRAVFRTGEQFEEDKNDMQKEISLATHTLPSELACSQKCLHQENCNYQKYDSASQKCHLMQKIAAAKEHESNSNRGGVLRKKIQQCKQETNLCNTVPGSICKENCIRVYSIGKKVEHKCCRK
eukprot:gene17735-19508_t